MKYGSKLTKQNAFSPKLKKWQFRGKRGYSGIVNTCHVSYYRYRKMELLCDCRGYFVTHARFSVF